MPQDPSPRLRTLLGNAAFRWALAVAGGLVGAALLLFAFVYWQSVGQEEARIDAIVTREAWLVAQASSDAEAAALLRAWLAEDLHGVRYAGLFGPDGARIAGNLLVPPRDLPVDGAAHRAVFGPILRARNGTDPEVVRGVARRMGSGGAQAGTTGTLLVLGYDVDELEEVEGAVLRGLGWGLLPAVLLSLAGGLLLAWRSERRVAALHGAMGRIVQGGLRERLPVARGGSELDRLAAAVNGMLDQIEALVGELRTLGEGIAHELRTPLTRMRVRLERARGEARPPEAFQEVADRAIASLDQALAVVAGVLRLGELEHGRRQERFGPVDLAGVLGDAAALYEPVAEEKGVLLRLHLPTTAPCPPVRGDRDLLLEAVGNVVDNAVKWAPAGSEVVLALATGRDGGVVASVADQGPGIPSAERARVLQRFYRGERSRTAAGNGLGLALVAAVARLHGFALRLGDTPGGGCTVELACPATAAVGREAAATVAMPPRRMA